MGAGVAAAFAVRLVVGPGVVVALTVVMCVAMLVRHVTTLPPGFPVPLHWLIVIGIAGLTLDPDATVHATVPPPPFPDPLHWVTVAPEVVAGKGLQLTLPPPPFPEPSHSLTVAAVTGLAPGVSALMLFVIETSHVIGCAASLSDALHCLTDVTRLVDWVVNVPLPGEHGSSEHSRVTVVVEPVMPRLIVLTTVTRHVMPVVAPAGPAPTPLHCPTSRFAAWAAGGDRANHAKENAPASRRASAAECHVPREVEVPVRAFVVSLLMRVTDFLGET
ncbi:MAG: hypothetical protein ACXV4A_05240 [Actinomycetes bacterium]